MYVAWVQMIIGIVIFLAGAAAIVAAWRKIAGYRAAGHGGGAWSWLRAFGFIIALIATLVMIFATELGGAHFPLDRQAVDDLGSEYFDEHYYAHGQVGKNGFDEWQRYVDPDYDNAKATVDGNESGTYCIKVTREFGGRYGEDGHSSAYQPTDTEQKTICIPIVWNAEDEDYEATESTTEE